MNELDFSQNDAAEDHKFLYTDVLKVDDRPWLSGMPDLETRNMLISEAESFFTNVVSPLRLSSDVKGARLENGKVKTPEGFKEAYKQTCEYGFNAPTIPEELGGAGISALFAQTVEEFTASASLAFLMNLGFTTSSVLTISKFGDKTLAEKLIPNIISGEWLATMCLTEPQAGSDLAQVRTLAVPQDDGTYAITGDKIFITGGDGDLGSNIVHVVLARIQDKNGSVVPGLPGLGVFVVLRNKLDTGEENGVSVVGIEHKMGLHGGATCSMHFESAQGFKLADGEKGSAAGMAAMFDMMNHARLSTAISAVGVASKAADMASYYANDRTAGHAAGLERSDKPSAIIKHPDIYRAVASTWSLVEGARAVLTWGGLLLAEAKDHPDEKVRKASALKANLLTPLLKAYVTDASCQACDDCIQVFGGYGYVQETGIEQLYRDLRASRIYEGTNGIQAQDFVMRRMAGRGEEAIQLLITEIRDSASELSSSDTLNFVTEQLEKALSSLERAVEAANFARQNKVRSLLSVSLDLAHLFGIVLVGWRSLISADVANKCNSPLAERKAVLAHHWASSQLPLVAGLEAKILVTLQ